MDITQQEAEFLLQLLDQTQVSGVNNKTTLLSIMVKIMEAFNQPVEPVVEEVVNESEDKEETEEED